VRVDASISGGETPRSIAIIRKKLGLASAAPEAAEIARENVGRERGREPHAHHHRSQARMGRSSTSRPIRPAPGAARRA
jgi:hypothetical protein